jgi:hypothetical protein
MAEEISGEGYSFQHTASEQPEGSRISAQLRRQGKISEHLASQVTELGARLASVLGPGPDQTSGPQSVPHIAAASELEGQLASIGDGLDLTGEALGELLARLEL